MSLKSWKEEFCPKEASEFKGKHKRTIVNRDLKKWEGLTPENLMKHGLRCDRGFWGVVIKSSGSMFSFEIDADTCALCKNFHDGEGCLRCPLCIVRSKVRCDSRRPNERLSPYNRFTREYNPARMIYWLRRAKEMLKQ